MNMKNGSINEIPEKLLKYAQLEIINKNYETGDISEYFFQNQNNYSYP